MQPLETFLAELQSQLKTSSDPQKIQDLRYSPLLKEHELLQVTYALLAKRHGMAPFKPQLFPLRSGAIPLFRQGCYPWSALPYPKEHAQLGSLLVQLEDLEMHKIAEQMSRFQEATLDHNKKPIYSLFQQEKGISSLCLNEANTEFFNEIGLIPSDHFRFSDHELCMISRRTDTMTLICMGSGCKSGMGALLYHNAGIINYGPQLLPIGESAGFGLAGRAQNGQLNEEADHFSMSYLCRLAAPSLRKTGFSHLQDSGYSSLWMRAEVKEEANGISIRCHFETLHSLNKIVFSFFGKGEAASVAGSHKLSPRSLDRYQGPPQPLVFLDGVRGVRIDVIDGISAMEVIPLAGDDSFWGADFLVAYTLNAPTIAFALSPIAAPCNK